MNKLFFALLLICVISVSVQAFVKRDAPAAAPADPNAKNAIDDFVKQIAELGASAKKTLEENFNSEKVKEEVQKITQQIQDGLNSIKGAAAGSTPKA